MLEATKLNPSLHVEHRLGSHAKAAWRLLVVSAVWGVTCLLMCGNSEAQTAESYEEASPKQEHDATKSSDKVAWNSISCTDSKAWEVCVFGGEGDVVFEKDAVKMSAGDPLTGVKCLVKMPRENFEIELESRRTSNFDFFCGLTFPVGEGQCSLILGGWAGAIVGLSSIDGEDASENATKSYQSFDNDQWYKVRVRVDDQRVRCWVDDKMVVDQARAEHEFDIRVEMDLCKPVGIAAFMCDAEFRNFRWRPLK